MLTPVRDGPIQTIRFALTGARHPALTETLPIGDLARRALLAALGDAERLPSPPALSGHSAAGPAQDQHRHPFCLPSDENADGYIDHLTLYFPEPLTGGQAQQIFANMRRIWTIDSGREWHLEALGAWSPGEMQSPDGPWAPASVWESATPFLLPRFPKQHRDGRPKLNDRGEQIDGPEDQVRREWSLRTESGAPRIIMIERLPALPLADGRTLGWLSFDRTRTGGGATSGFAYGLRLTFAAPVAGPICLGYSCHFGLGQFRRQPDQPPWPD